MPEKLYSRDCYKWYAYCLIFGIIRRVFKIYAQEDVTSYIMGKSKVVLLRN
jgi:hypothetical protein